MTRYLSQLEPDSLLDRYAEHPPIGFETIEVAGTPAFMASFDLLTTADAQLRERFLRAPGYRLWSRLLRWRTAFVGSTVSEFALFPRATDPRDLPGELVERFGRQQRMMVIKDVAQGSPLLDRDSQAWCEQFFDACADAGYVLVDGQALAYVPLDFADEEEYLARLSRSRRKNIRRKLRGRDAVQVQTIACGDPRYADEALIDRYYALYENVYAQSVIHFDKLSRDFFAAVLREAGRGGVVFAYYDGETLIGWNLCFISGGKLIDKYLGFAYPQAREHNLYFTSWFHNLGYAKAQGLSHYVAGWTDPEIKAYLGAQFTLTRHAVYLRNPLLRALARRCAKYFESDQRWA